MTSTPSNQLPPGVSPNHPLGPLTELIDELRDLTRESAENGTSDDLGVTTITAGNASEALVPVFFRSTWPPGANSRHKFIWLRPSLPAFTIGSAINDAFQFIEAGGVVKKTTAVWAGSNPFTDPSTNGVDARDIVRRAVGLDDPPTEEQIIKMMECTMSGFMQVTVEPVSDATKCHICGVPHTFTTDQMAASAFRESAFKLPAFCKDCAEALGVEGMERVYREVEAERNQSARDSLGNPEG